MADAEFMLQIITNAFGPSLRKVDVIGFGTNAVSESGKNQIRLRIRLEVPAQPVELHRKFRFDVRFVEIEQDVTKTVGRCIHIELAQQVLGPVVGGIEIDNLGTAVHRGDVIQQLFGFCIGGTGDDVEADIIFGSQLLGLGQRERFQLFKSDPIPRYTL